MGDEIELGSNYSGSDNSSNSPVQKSDLQEESEAMNGCDATTLRGADKCRSYTALAVYTLLNIYTYFARYIPSILKDVIAQDMGLSDVQTGFLFTAFITCYMVVSPLVGLLTDKQVVPRRLVAVCGVVLYSLATAAAGLCRSFALLVVARVFFGAGEAAFVTVSAPILCDYFPPQQRNIVMGIFLGATPIGCALGYLIAGAVGSVVGWRRTFVYLSVPGLLAFLLFFMKEPKLGAFDAKSGDNEDEKSKADMKDEEKEEGTSSKTSSNSGDSDEEDDGNNSKPSDKLLNSGADKPRNAKGFAECVKESARTLCNAPYIVAVGGYIADTFGMGGFSDWLPTFFVRYYSMDVWEAGLVNGVIVVVCGCLGTVVGSVLADLARKRAACKHPYLLVSGASMLACAVTCVLGLYLFTSSRAYIEAMLAVGLFWGWFCNGPINAIILNSVPPSHRSSANGLAVLLIHLFGDAVSPSFIGLLSDSTNNNLRMSLALVPLSLFVSAFVWLAGWVAIPSKNSFFTIT